MPLNCAAFCAGRRLEGMTFVSLRNSLIRRAVRLYASGSRHSRTLGTAQSAVILQADIHNNAVAAYLIFIRTPASSPLFELHRDPPYGTVR